MMPRLPALPALLPPRADPLVPRRINRAPSPLLAVGIPWASIALASLAPFSPIVASAPVMPPLAFMTLLGWRMLRPSLLPVWAGLPLGLWDDLFSGQPFGSAIVLWSAAMLLMEAIDGRFLWRGFAQDWLAASGLIAGTTIFGAVFAGLAARAVPPAMMLTPMALGIVLFPVVNAVVARLDRVRLLPVRRIGP